MVEATKVFSGIAKVFIIVLISWILWIVRDLSYYEMTLEAIYKL